MNTQQAKERTVKTGKNNNNGIKAIIMIGSLAATIAGWGALAAGQMDSTTTVAAAQSATIAPQTSTTTQQATVRQATIPSTQTRPVARTRSSR